MLPAILGFAGPKLTREERAFFAESEPAGFILFARNVENPDQLRALTDDLKAISGRAQVPILVDQEGGRVARLRPPIWPAFPAGWRFAELYEKAPISAIQASRLNAAALAAMLLDVGINVDCVPMLDLRRSEGADIIGDRALGSEPMQVAALGQAILDGLASGGVAGVIKHMPGHGRALVDSHHELPIVSATEAELESDLEPFRSLRETPLGMTAHLLFPAWDEENPATHSPTIIAEIIRERIGFKGLLMSDDLAMEALKGSPGERARRAIDAGCDIALYCSGDLAANRDVAASLPEIVAKTRAALEAAIVPPPAATADLVELAEQRDALLALA